MFAALAQGAVPVYLGPRSVFNVLPHKQAVVFAGDFPSPADLVTYLKNTAGDPVAFAKHFQWGLPDVDRVLMERDCGEDNAWYCQACERFAYLAAQKRAKGTAVPEPLGGNKHRNITRPL